jgi:hypothetical protein
VSPCVGVAALTMTLGSLALEQSHFAPLGTQSVVGYLSGAHILPVLWLAVVPGILGHQVFCAACCKNGKRSCTIMVYEDGILLLLQMAFPLQSIQLGSLQGLNLSLKYISPLALSLSTGSEPIIGSVLGMECSCLYT